MDYIAKSDIMGDINMGRRETLIQKIRNNPSDVRFDDACKVAGWLSFGARGGKGSHEGYSRPEEQLTLVFTKRKNGKIPPYQARQLILMIDKYEHEL